MPNRLPLCGMELHALEPSNDLETTVTEPATPRKPRVYPRNTKELTVSEAIEKLRKSHAEEQIAVDKVREEHRRDRRHTLLRVPEVVRDHVESEGAKPAPEPSSAPTDGIASDADTSWLHEEPIDARKYTAGEGTD